KQGIRFVLKYESSYILKRVLVSEFFYNYVKFIAIQTLIWYYKNIRWCNYMNSQTEFSLFIEYLQIEKNASPYTVEFYTKDLNEFFQFLEQEGIRSLDQVDYRNIRVFLTKLLDKNMSRSTVLRKISSLRSLYRFLERENLVQHNPFIQIILPKSPKTIPTFLYEEEMEELFTVSDTTTDIGQRNQALLETLYATGIRVSECQALKLSNIDFTVGTMFVKGKGKKERYVLFGDHAHKALHLYIHDRSEER